MGDPVRVTDDLSHVRFEDLYRTHYRRIVRLCHLLLRDAPEAEEVAQEVFLKLLRVSKVVGPAVFTTMELGVRELPKHASSLAYLRAALDGGWPQERCEGEQTQGCNNDSLTMLFDEEDN